MVDDIIEFEQTDFIISGNLPKPPLHARQFSEFFGSQSFLQKEHIIHLISISSLRDSKLVVEFSPTWGER